MQKEVLAPVSAVGIRERNRRLLLQLLRVHGNMSRAELKVAAGLSSAAVTNVSADLIDEGLVKEAAGSAPAAGRIGRPPTALQLDTDRTGVLAVQIGAGLVQVGICGLMGDLVASDSAEFPLGQDPETVLTRVADMLRALLREPGHRDYDLRGIGVGAAGIVDKDRRVNLRAPSLKWSNVAIADFLEDALHLRTVVDHNVRAMAMAEAGYGVGQGLESLALVYARTGVGGGLIVNSREYRGGTHGAFELGHIRVSSPGEACSCGGHGCLETVISDGVLATRMRQAGLLRPGAELDRAGMVAVLREGIGRGEAAALQIRDSFVDHLANAIAIVVNMLNPQVIVFAGLLADLGEELIEPLREAVPTRIMPVLRDGVRIERTAFGANIGLMGAATIALTEFVFGDSLLVHQGTVG